MKTKSQIFSADAVIAGLILITILVTTAMMWDFVEKSSVSIDESNDIEIVSRAAFNSLIETSGNPPNWSNFALADFNESAVYSLGLTNGSDLVLDISKILYLQRFNSSKYDDYKTILGLQGYEFYIEIDEWNNNTYDNAYADSYKIGIRTPVDAENIVALRRYVLLGDEKGRATFNVWRRQR